MFKRMLSHSPVKLAMSTVSRIASEPCSHKVHTPRIKLVNVRNFNNLSKKSSSFFLLASNRTKRPTASSSYNFRSRKPIKEYRAELLTCRGGKKIKDITVFVKENPLASPSPSPVINKIDMMKNIYNTHINTETKWLLDILYKKYVNTPFKVNAVKFVKRKPVLTLICVSSLTVSLSILVWNNPLGLLNFAVLFAIWKMITKIIKIRN